MNDKTESKQREEKSFLQRYAPIIAVLVTLVIVCTSIVGTVMVLKREAAKVNKHVELIALADLPGTKNRLSKRSARQLETMSKQYEHIIGTVVVRYNYGKYESPFIFYWADKPEVKKVLESIITRVAERQASGLGRSSIEAAVAAAKNPERAARALRNSEEARMGLIKCIPIDEATLTYPELKTIATGICYATIPPFESKSSMAIVMLTDSPLTKHAELAEMRRILLALQIDIYNRDFKGRETWAHP